MAAVGAKVAAAALAAARNNLRRLGVPGCLESTLSAGTTVLDSIFARKSFFALLANCRQRDHHQKQPGNRQQGR